MRLAAPDAGTNFESRPARAASSARREELRVLALVDPHDSVSGDARAQELRGGRRVSEESRLPFHLFDGQALRLDPGAVLGGEDVLFHSRKDYSGGDQPWAAFHAA